MNEDTVLSMDSFSLVTRECLGDYGRVSVKFQKLCQCGPTNILHSSVMCAPKMQSIPIKYCT